MQEAFELGFAAVIGAACGMAVAYSLFWVAMFIVQFAKRYRQASRPAYGINAKTVRDRAAFALHAALFWPTI